MWYAVRPIKFHPITFHPIHVSPKLHLLLSFNPPKKFFKLGETLFYLKLGEMLCVKRDWVKRDWVKRDWVKRNWMKRDWVKRNWANCYHTLFSSYHHQDCLNVVFPFQCFIGLTVM